MEKASVETVVRALNDAQVRYLIVGGFAVVAHGYLRFTADLDLILDFQEENLKRALAVLADQGYRPLVPVPLDQFIDAKIRAQWIQEKQLTVFSLFSPIHSGTAVDLFVKAPLDFDRAYAAAIRMDLDADLQATFISFEDLIFLKKQAGRSKDLLDIDKLQAVKGQAHDSG